MPIICKQCGIEKSRSDFYIRKNGHLSQRKCKDCVRNRVRDLGKSRYKKQRQKALEIYGGSPPSCACCGETHNEFLHLDHLDGSGAQHREELQSLSIYRWLMKNKYPDIPLRVLCANCNMSLGLYGYCPHSRPSS